jgi:predicted dinucleotide-binding enzyme
MRIGVIGAGNIGIAMGTIWAAKGHQILFSFTNDSMRLQKAVVAAGVNGRSGTPAEAVAFGEVVLLAVPWAAVGEALKAAGLFKSKVLFSCVNCLKPDFSGLAIGMTTSAAEEIARAAPDARVVEALPPMAEVLAELITGWPDSRSAHSTAATMRRRSRLLPACCATSTSNRSTPGR